MRFRSCDERRAACIVAEPWQRPPLAAAHRPLPPPTEPPPFPRTLPPARLQDTTNNPIYTGESAGLSLEDERMQVRALPSCFAAWQRPCVWQFLACARACSQYKPHLWLALSKLT